MSTEYQRLGDSIREVNLRNRELKVTNLLGMSISKKFIPSIANTIGTDMSTYKIIKRNQFAYVPVTSRNGEKITIALLDCDDEAIISQAYTVFEIVNHEQLLPKYLMMWFRRPEFDRYARFHSHGSAREVFDWDELCEVRLPIPSLARQHEIVSEYETLGRRIRLNEQMIARLEETAQALYRKMFVEGENDRNAILKDICDVKSGFAFKSEWWQANGVPVIKINNIHDNTIYRNECDCVAEDKARIAYKSIAHKGDIVIALTGNVGRTSIVPDEGYLVNQRVGLFNVDVIAREFLYLALNSNEIQNTILSVGGGSVQTNISPTDIESIPIKLPVKESMKGFHEQASLVFNAIFLKQQENLKLTELQSLLLARMGR